MAKKQLEYDYLFKLLIIGDSGVGKSSLLLRYTDKVFTGSFISTIGVDFKVKTITVDGMCVKLQIWDTAGHERFRTITSTYYRGAHGVMVVYDVCQITSFINVERWMDESAKFADPHIVKILVGNKNDNPEMRMVSAQDGKKLANSFKCEFLETSAKDDCNVDQMFSSLTSEILRKLIEQESKQQDKNTIKLGNKDHRGRKKGKCCK